MINKKVVQINFFSNSINIHKQIMQKEKKITSSLNFSLHRLHIKSILVILLYYAHSN